MMRTRVRVLLARLALAILGIRQCRWGNDEDGDLHVRRVLRFVEVRRGGWTGGPLTWGC